MNRINELEERISLLRAEMHNLTGKDRRTHQRMIYELADKIARLQRERSDELSSVSWDAHDIDDETKEIVVKYSGRGAPGAMPCIPRGLPVNWLSFEDVNFLIAALDRVRCNSRREVVRKQELRKRLDDICSY